MRSSKPGKSTSARKKSAVEVLSVSPHGIWLSVNGDEHQLGYDDHPWFRDARVSEIFNVQLLHGSHLRWPDLDVDLDVDSLRNPGKYPLTARRASRR